jgi:alcohol dehydrogenase
MLFDPDPVAGFSFPPIPTRIEFGDGRSEEAGTIARTLGAKTAALVVTDRGVADAGLVDPVERSLAAAGLGVERFAEVTPDSGTHLVMKGAEVAKSVKADVVFGIGGGSAMDTAKAIAAMATNAGHITDYVGLDRVPRPALPSVCVPTTAGTGSEVSVWCVMTDDDTGLKVSVGGTGIMASVALCDPALTRGLPPSVTAATGMDALGHAVECFVNRACQPVSGALAIQAVAEIGASLRTAVRDGADAAARYRMMTGALLAGIAMNPTRLGLAHALAMPLGSWQIKIPHGTIIAVTLPVVSAFNHGAAPGRFAAVARALGENVTGLSEAAAAERAVEALQRMKEDVGIPRGLSDCGMREEWVDQVVDEAMKSGNVTVNPRETTRDDLAAVLRQAM